MNEHSIKLKQKYEDRKGKYNMTYTNIVDLENIVNVKQDSTDTTKLFASTWYFVKTSPRKLRRAVTSSKFKAIMKSAVTVLAVIAGMISIFYINILVAAGFGLIWPPLAFIYLLLCTLSAISWLYATFTFQSKLFQAEDLITSTFGMTDLFNQQSHYWEPTGVSILDEEE
jgi:ABC-type multidrug transport system fused ATPase/permease subunit